MDPRDSGPYNKIGEIFLGTKKQLEDPNLFCKAGIYPRTSGPYENGSEFFVGQLDPRISGPDLLW